ncbi:monocyte to macrophage differentiation factor isoform X6 [Bos indicus]|uniref:Monocyte to macrophage differentiation factor isoform X6 n=1 Tax=Bos indicus TaxID=9915 RepID=A0ABM4QZ74_BOSIN
MPGNVRLMGTSSVLLKAKGNRDVLSLEHEVSHEDWRGFKGGCNTGSAMVGKTLFMNHRAPANGRYKPTCYEHAANCYTHAFLIVPAIVGSALLHRLSDDCWEKITAWIYGMGLCALFIVSTVFHIVAWKKSHLRTVEHWFHMCDRMVIYFFIAASYAPWLNLRELGPLASHMRWFIWLMAAGGTIYVFLYHEKYKVIELFFYLTMGFSPALVVTSMMELLQVVWRPYSKNLSSAGLGHQQDTGRETERVGGFCDLLVPAMTLWHGI